MKKQGSGFLEGLDSGGRSAQKPPYLKDGDEVALVAPARWMAEQHLATAEDWLRSVGLVPVRAPHVLGVWNQFSGSDAVRAADLDWALRRASVRAIWCVRGGYGSARTVDLVDWNLLREDPKWIAGYSDPTVLLAAAWGAGVASIHGTMPVNVAGNSTESLRTLHAVWRGEASTGWKIAAPGPADWEELGWRAGTARGPLVGGNLSVLFSLLGSKTFPNLKGCLLFIEDLDEYVYHVDRMLVGLKRSGALQGVVGVVVGGMTDLHDNAVPFGRSVGSLVLEHFPDIPVASGFPMGHLADNQAFEYGGVYTLSTKEFFAELLP
jgi:muramoyltetrapeptide carboxypeptidase